MLNASKAVRRPRLAIMPRGEPRKRNRNPAANRLARREVALAADEDRRLLSLRLPRGHVRPLQVNSRRRMSRRNAGIDETAGRAMKGKDPGKAEVCVELGNVQSFISAVVRVPVYAESPIATSLAAVAAPSSDQRTAY